MSLIRLLQFFDVALVGADIAIQARKYRMEWLCSFLLLSPAALTGGSVGDLTPFMIFNLPDQPSDGELSRRREIQEGV